MTLSFPDLSTSNGSRRTARRVAAWGTALGVCIGLVASAVAWVQRSAHEAAAGEAAEAHATFATKSQVAALDAHLDALAHSVEQLNQTTLSTIKAMAELEGTVKTLIQLEDAPPPRRR